MTHSSREMTAEPATLLGSDPAFLEALEQVSRLAQLDRPALVIGERGTGKELIAERLHFLSPRWEGPFTKVNCAALSETLLESELFGHEAGAFTGARQRRRGRFERSDGGTLFLDEIATASARLQEQILRVIEYGEFERVGGEQTLKVDVRILSATNKDLKTEVAAGRFREDLYYRLHVVPLTLPPLRERREDIALLVGHFLAKLAPRAAVDGRTSAAWSITDDALGRLLAYGWPGNVRELENVVEQAMVFADGRRITIGALPQALQGSSETLAVPRGEMALPDVLEDLEKQLILKAYEKANGVKTETARLLGVKTSALYYKLEKYGIE